MFFFFFSSRRRHTRWTGDWSSDVCSSDLDRKVLLLAYHLLGAETLEKALFDGYLRQIRQRHPTAVLPALHQSDGILADAERQRSRDGDERFFAELNGGAAGAADDPWSALLGSGTWTADSYAA